MNNNKIRIVKLRSDINSDVKKMSFEERVHEENIYVSLTLIPESLFYFIISLIIALQLYLPIWLNITISIIIGLVLFGCSFCIIKVMCYSTIQILTIVMTLIVIFVAKIITIIMIILWFISFIRPFIPYVFACFLPIIGFTTVIVVSIIIFFIWWCYATYCHRKL